MYTEIIEDILRASKMAKKLGIDNILQPGLVKEMIIADLLNHTIILTKHDADAHHPNNPQEKYEYLSCKEGGSGQMDRMFKSPPDKRKRSILRITRNDKIYYAVFYKNDQTKCKEIYEIEPSIMLKEANRQLDACSNDIAHLGFSIKWAKNNGIIVYENKS
jgi:hypothetical protein|tara:strand:+ start:1233 stop:1715 length:483 start_codon:yes stop_codon:yes gene_type:complete